MKRNYRRFMGLFAQLQSIQAGYRNVFMCFHENIAVNIGLMLQGNAGYSLLVA
ncbi:hypothetical protein KU392_02375 [Advenella alkanexedens]|uniref:Uncharacterized protein n=1 Tax=Advenella alkanexedens TaxID=1481665 RepID=A0ABS6NLM0_9BURK|nr:hypothetical protein [Advenella alkanexedens]MBV4396101.1 hypothetical protein [Advenella alkanexedens]